MRFPFPTILNFLDRLPARVRQQRRALLRVLAVGLEERLPLAPLIKSWAQDERGRQQQRLLRLSQLLESDIALPDAVEAVPGLLGDEDILAIRFDAQTGTRAAAIRQRLEMHRPQPIAGVHWVPGTMIYVLFVAFIMIVLTTFNMIWISPQIENILADFGLDEPMFFQRWNAFAKFVVEYWFLFAFAALVAATCYFSARPGRLLRRFGLGGLLFPVREWGSADVLQKLAVATAAGRPIPGAVSTLARYHFDPAVRERLLFVRNEIEHGAGVWQSLADVGLLKWPEVRALETADPFGDHSWVLARLADVRRERMTRRFDRLSQLLLPALVLILGGFVLFQALALFVPVIKMLTSLT